MLNKCFVISYYTFKQLLKSKILYVSCFLALVILIATYVASEFTYGVPGKVALDFGLGMLSFSSLAISIFLGATLLPSEIDSRTVYMVISRPVPRWVFISGKILGLVGVLIFNILLLSVMTVVCAYFMGTSLDQVVLSAIFFNLMEAILLLMVVVFFSLFTNSILASSISFLILIMGHAVKDGLNLTFVAQNPFLKKLLSFYHVILPGFYKLNLKDFVVYQKTISSTYLLQAFSYSVTYSVFLFLMVIYLFNKKNLD